MDSKTIDWYTRASDKLDEIGRGCVTWSQVPDFRLAKALAQIKGSPNVSQQFDDFLDIWHERMRPYKWSRDTRRRVEFIDQADYLTFLSADIAPLRAAARLELNKTSEERSNPNVALFELLHPIIANRAWDFYTAGHYRQAVETSLTAVFDYIRARTGSQLDGQALITEVFKLEGGKLVFSSLDTESGRNEQKGFINVFSGAYVGIRNPLAHSTIHSLEQKEVAEHMVFASLLARKVDRATLVEENTTDGQ